MVLLMNESVELSVIIFCAYEVLTE